MKVALFFSYLENEYQIPDQSCFTQTQTHRDSPSSGVMPLEMVQGTHRDSSRTQMTGEASPRTMKWRSMFRIPLAYTYSREREVQFFLSILVDNPHILISSRNRLLQNRHYFFIMWTCILGSYRELVGGEADLLDDGFEPPLGAHQCNGSNDFGMEHAKSPVLPHTNNNNNYFITKAKRFVPKCKFLQNLF